MSIYITGNYYIIVEFDNLNNVSNGEGWDWRSSQLTLLEIISILEKFIGVKVANWESISKTGKLLSNSIEIDNDLLICQENKFKEKFQFGAFFIPELPDYSYWAVSPFGYKKPLTKDIEEFLKSLNPNQLYCRLHIQVNDDLSTVYNEFSTLINAIINNDYIETNAFSINIYKSKIIEKDYCIEIYPIDYGHDNYQSFVENLKGLIDILMENDFNFEIEINK